MRHSKRPFVSHSLLLFLSSSCHAWTSISSRSRLVGRPSRNTRSNVLLFLATPSDRQPNDPATLIIDTSDDPFQILGLSDNPTADPKEIKRAYKRMALKYHPDVAASTDSPAEKRKASERFAKINWAYQQLNGKNGASSRTSTAKSSNSASSAKGTATGGWTPPHRRSGSSASSSSSTGSPSSVDWTDFMPKNDEYDKQYDAGGDSFASIFRDLFAGAAVGGYSVLNDLVEFLETSTSDAAGGGSFGGFGSAGDKDAELRVLLQTGTLEQVGNEMEDTELVVDQLSAKLRKLQDERVMVQTELNAAIRYMEKLEMEEKLDELKAREKIVEGYLKKSRKRLLQLQTRYKEMIVQGGDDRRARSRTGQSWSRPSSATSSSSTSTTSMTAASSSSPSSSASTSASQPFSQTTSDSNADPADAWKSDSFGSFGRKRSSSGRRRASTSSGPEEAASSASSTRATAAARESAASSSSSQSRSSSQSNSNPTTTTTRPSTSDLPPHRRIMSSASDSENRNQRDMRRLRELKVDEEFEKLKKELGM